MLVNAQARELELGSGGFDVLYANLTRGLGLAPEDGAHVMALPYAPGQLATRFAEEDGDASLERIDGVPVVCLGLHSQLAPVCAALAGRRVAYVQLAGGALPVSLSDTVRALKARRLLETAIAVVAVPRRRPPVRHDRVGADAGGRARRRGRRLRDRARASSGRGSRWGHGGLAVAEAANVAAALGGAADRRAARLVRRRARAAPRPLAPHALGARALPRRGARRLAARARPPGGRRRRRGRRERLGAACAPLPLSHMGRGPDDDPWFFAAAFAAGRLAAA